jgi:HAD superfamily hydrolase (TIGR01509 family)
MIEAFYRNTVPLKKGAFEFLAGLAKDGVRMCVATVTDKYLVEAALTRLQVRQYFGEIFTTADIGCGKNDPEIYRTALAYLGTEKCETLVFEDVLHALMTAKNDGFPVAAVYDEHEPRQKEMQANGDYYITDFEMVTI